MIEPWYWLQEDTSVHHVIQATELTGRKYPPIMRGDCFLRLEDTVTHYARKEPMFMPDFLFAPTFMLENAMFELWQQLQPELRGKSVQFFEEQNRLDAPMALHAEIKQELGRVVTPILRREKIANRHFLHITLAGGQLWLASLTAVEAILCQGAMGLTITSVESR